MGARKYQFEPQIPAEAFKPVHDVDYGRAALTFVIGLQAAYGLGHLLNLESLTTGFMFYSQFLAPAGIFIFAQNWKSGLKLSLLGATLIPVVCSLFLLVVGVLDPLVSSTSPGFIEQMNITIRASILIWAASLGAIVPSIVVGALARLVMSKLTKN